MSKSYSQLTKFYNILYNFINFSNKFSGFPKIFGSQGKMKKFMSKNTLKATSIILTVAVITWLLVPSLKSPLAQSCRAGQYNFTKTLYKGLKDSQVRDLQEMLAYCENILDKDKLTGYYGPLTVEAVKAFQRKYGISQTGVFGPVTRAKANELYGAGAAQQQPSPNQQAALIGLLQQLAQGNPQLQAILPLLLSLLSQQGQPSQAPAPSGEVSVSLASDNPTGGTLIETQSGAVLLKFVVSNGTNSEVTISGLKLRRTGVSSDYSLKNVYLYVNNERVSDPASVTQNYANFTGLNVKIPAGSSVTFSVVADVSSGTSGQTVGFSLESASDISGVTATGNFPIRGFNFQIASKPSDFANISFTGTVQPTGGTVNAGSMAYTVYRDQVQVNNREVLFKGLRLRLIGSVSQQDLQNFALYIDGQKIADGSWEGSYVVFKPQSPITLKTGNRNFEVRADIVGGSTRQFSFSLRYPSDFDVVDSQYNAGVEITGTPRNTGTLTIQGGQLVIQRLPLSSPYVVKDSRTVIGKFELNAYGEPVKVETLKLKVTFNGASFGLRNGALYLNNSQVGPTLNISTSSSGTEFNNLNFVIYPGQKAILEVWADLTDPGNTSEPASGKSITLTLLQGSNNAQGTQSLNLISVPSSNMSADSVSVVTGQATVAKDSSYGDQSFVKGKVGAKIGSYVVSASQYEDLTITSVQISLSTTTAYRNLRISLAPNDVRVVPASSENFSVNVNVSKGTQKIIEVYADILTSAPTGTPIVSTATISYITPSGNSGSPSITGQQITVTESGSLNFALHSDTPVSRYLVTNSTGEELLRIKLSASKEENIKIEEIVVRASTTKPGYFYNLTLTDGQTSETRYGWENIGSETSTIRFTGLNFVVNANSEKVLSLKSSVAAYSSVNINTPATITPAITEIVYRGVDSSQQVTATTSALVGNQMTVYRGNLKVEVKPVSGWSFGTNFVTLALTPIIKESNVDSIKLGTATFTVISNKITTSTNTVLEVYDGGNLIATSSQVSWNEGNTSKQYVINFNNRDISGAKNYTLRLVNVSEKSAQGTYSTTFRVDSFQFGDGVATEINLDSTLNPGTQLSYTYQH